jgi:hypothetical protein
LHDFADKVLFLSAQMLIIGLDTALQRIEAYRQGQNTTSLNART